MIVSEKHKFVFMCIPKTGTMAMEQILKPYGGVYRNGEPWARHPNRLPTKYKDYFIFATARNPYSRAVSLWFSAIESWPKFKYNIVETCGKEFKSFLKMINTPKVNGNFGGLPLVSTASFIKTIRIDRFLRFENLNQEITALPFWQSDPPTYTKNVRSHRRPHWSSYYQDNAMAELVRQWAKKDFELLDYDIEIPTNGNSNVSETMKSGSRCFCGSGNNLNKCCDSKLMKKYFDNFYNKD